jgi:hypothetical protein
VSSAVEVSVCERPAVAEAEAEWSSVADIESDFCAVPDSELDLVLSAVFSERVSESEFVRDWSAVDENEGVSNLVPVSVRDGRGMQLMVVSTACEQPSDRRSRVSSPPSSYVQ